MNIGRIGFSQYNRQKGFEEAHGLDLYGKKILLHKLNFIKTILGKAKPLNINVWIFYNSLLRIYLLFHILNTSRGPSGKWHSYDIFSLEDPLFVTLNIYSPMSNLPSPLRYVRIRTSFPGIHIYCNDLSRGCFVWDLSGLIMVLRSQIESFHNNKQGSKLNFIIYRSIFGLPSFVSSKLL